MAIQQTPYSLRVEPVIMEKFKLIAKDHGRSLNKEIEFVMRETVNRYEKEYGSLPIQTGKQSG